MHRLIPSCLAAALALSLSLDAGASRDGQHATSGRKDQPAVGESGRIERITEPGRYTFALQHDGRARQYLIHVPKRYRPGSPAPMVIALHGGGGSMAYQADDGNYGLISKSEAAGFIAVFPNGISPVGSGLLATWNAGACCARARDFDVDDVGFIRTMVERLHRQLDVDRARVFATGMSNGAMMAYRLACEIPGTIRGIMAVAGTDNTRTCSPAQPVPILHVHARNDDHVLYDGGAGPAAVEARLVASFVSVPATISKWVGLNRASPRPTRVLTVAGAWCDRYAAGPGGAPVELCVTDTGGHSWPGGGSRRGKEPSTAISATSLMWDFFSRL